MEMGPRVGPNQSLWSQARENLKAKTKQKKKGLSSLDFFALKTLFSKEILSANLSFIQALSKPGVFTGNL